jgi:L-lysine exporter family protein LysE/ArgO
MTYPFFTGFFLGLSLIIAIGAQNAFVLRQGILQKHVFFVSLFCALSDCLLIVIGITGISIFLSSFFLNFENIIYGFAALWIFIYGLIRLRSAFINNALMEVKKTKLLDFSSTIFMTAVLTFTNPHVYLDTMILIGSVSQNFSGSNKVAFACGACFASFVWFFSLSYGAKFLIPLMKKPNSWRILDGLIAIIMFAIGINLIRLGIWV